jgi:xanthine dehydrogenase accessory factor
VAFAEAVYTGTVNVEGVVGRRIDRLDEIDAAWERGEIPVLVDEEASSLSWLQPLVVIDGRMTKRPPAYSLDVAPLVIGLGPGFATGENCHVVIETNRGHSLGRVIWKGTAEADTGIPEAVLRHQADRVIRSPRDGYFQPLQDIGARVAAGETIAWVGEQAIQAPFDGVIRGLLHGGLAVTAGAKVGDIDPRNDPRFARLVSDKALAVAGGVLEAVLTRPEIRTRICV